MSDFFIGEIRMFSMNWAPQDWALCNGASMPIAQNQALYSLLSIQFGGDAKTNFLLPDLRGRAPLAAGTSPIFGSNTQGVQGQGGVETVTLTTAQVPMHTHSFMANSAPGNSNFPVNGALVSSTTAAAKLYGQGTTLAPINPGTIGVTGGAPHENMQPYLVTNFCISTAGIYPMRP